jgi:GNAT superfamily N-acetyltransferase
MNFREASIQDLSQLKKIEQAIIEYERQFAKHLKEDPIEYYDLKNLIERDDAIVMLAVNSNEIIGTAYALIKKSAPYKLHKYYAYLGFMYVSPEFRGKGINGELIKELINWSKTKGVFEFQLDVYAENKSAIEAYKKSNFRPNLLNMRMNVQEKNN